MTAGVGEEPARRPAPAPALASATRRALVAGLLATAVACAPVVLAAWIAAGGRGLAAAGLGAGLVGAFFSASKGALALVARRARALLLPAALGTYLFKIAVLGVVLVSLQGSGRVDLRWLAWSVVSGVVAWMAAELWVATHTRVPFYDAGAFRARHGDEADRVPPAARRR